MEWLRLIWVLECTAAAGRRERGSTHSQGLPVLGTGPWSKGRIWATAQPLCSFASSGLSQSPSTSRSSPTQQRVCQAAAVLWLSVIACHTTLQICSVLQAHLCSFCVTAEGQGDRRQVGSGLPTYHWYLFLQHTNLNAQHCLRGKKKNNNKTAFDCFDIISNTGVT